MSLGQINKFRVERKTDIGYMISNGKEEFFLHFNECDGKTLVVGEEVEAFIFLDKKNRPAATLKMPLVTLSKSNFLKVVNITNSGVFLDIGISKDMLLAKDDLPEKQFLWPQIGDVICGRLNIKNKRLFIKMLNKEEMLKNQTTTLEPNQTVNAYVYRIVKEGINLVDDNYNVIFVYYKNMRKQYRLGEKCEVKIININEDDYTGTLILQKELMIDQDALTIIKYLEENNRVMNYTSKTSAEVIYRVFKMSKAAFKRALGKLYKEKKVLLLEDKTILL